MTDTTIESPRRRFDEHYREFRADEGIPVHEGVVVDDVRTVDVDDWDRTGGRGAFINLDGMESICDVEVHEIPPGGRLDTQRHLHESLVFVMRGSGLTAIGSDEDAHTFEWDTGALFYLPHNTPYRHVNDDGEEPVRLLSRSRRSPSSTTCSAAERSCGTSTVTTSGRRSATRSSTPACRL